MSNGFTKIKLFPIKFAYFKHTYILRAAAHINIKTSHNGYKLMRWHIPNR